MAMEKISAGDPETRSADLVQENIDQLKALFPELVTEGPDGAVVNVDVLKALVGDSSVTDCDEKYGLNWHGKRRARQLALTPSTGTLRPAPDESVDWDTTQNLMIEGDNLEVLKLFQKSYARRIKLIYIDPPYNTGKDFVYPDNFHDSTGHYLQLTKQAEQGVKLSSNVEASGRFHTMWLNMMLPRLKAAHNLLTDDGVLMVSIDEHEVVNLRHLCDQVFGEECFVSVLTVLCNPKGRSQDKFFATNHEYVVIYGKQPLPKGFFAVEKGEEQVEEEYPEEDEGGKFRLLELRNTHREFGRHNRPNLFYPLYVDAGGQVSLSSDGTVLEILPIWDDGYEGCWTWDSEKAARDLSLLVGKRVGERTKVFRKSYANGAERMLKTILQDKSYTTERGQKAFNDLFDSRAKLFQAPKSPYLLSDLFETATGDNDIIMDFFAGSGTTAHAVMMRNGMDGGSRRYILVQLPEALDLDDKAQAAAVEFCNHSGLPHRLTEITKERLRRSASWAQQAYPAPDGDFGFRVFKLDSSNAREWEPDRDNLDQILSHHQEHLKGDRNEQDILYELLLKLGLDLCVPLETKEIAGKVVYSIGGGVLVACLAERIERIDVEPLAEGIVAWHQELAPAGDTTCVFRDSAFADDVAKTNMAAILEQHGIANVRSL